MGQWSNFVSWNCAKGAKGGRRDAPPGWMNGILITYNSIA